jgi:hypothetical protein
MALEWALRRSGARREAITYDELIGDQAASSRVRVADRSPGLISR